MNISMEQYEDWFKQPWKEFGLTEEQWREPMWKLAEEHRKVIFDIFNSKYKLTFTPETFGIYAEKR
jgi:hypothetical protein